MKKYILTSIITVIAIGALVVAVKPLAFGDKDSAVGEGSLNNEDGSRSHFSFNVKRNPNGKVVGQATIRNPSFKTGNGQNSQVQIEVSCLKVEGNVAIVGGMTKRKNSQAKAEAIYFAVQDNNGIDAIFRGFYFDDDASTDGDPQRCQSIGPDVPVFEPIAAGSVEVKAQ